MIRIVKITPSIIKLEGAHLSDTQTVERIKAICHKYKHMYAEGFPCGRKTRKKSGKRSKKWSDCPEICFTYLIPDDKNFIIRILVSDIDVLLKRYTKREIDLFTQLYNQDVADEILTIA